MSETNRFMLELEQGLTKISTSIRDEYNTLMDRLKQMQGDLNRSAHQRAESNFSFVEPANATLDTRPPTVARATSTAKKPINKEKYYEKCLKEIKTPIESRTRFLFKPHGPPFALDNITETKPPVRLENIQPASNSTIGEAGKTKKRSAATAEISLTLDEELANNGGKMLKLFEDDDDYENISIAPTSKKAKGKAKEPKAKKKTKKKNEEPEPKANVSVKPEPLLPEEDNIAIQPEPEQSQEPIEKRVNRAEKKKGKKKKESILVAPNTALQQLPMIPKTPMSVKRLSRLGIIKQRLSVSVKKSANKVKPTTRRAAAAAAARTAMTSKANAELAVPDAVKKEPSDNNLTTPQTERKLGHIDFLKNTASKFNKSIRSSIDNRKLKIKGSKGQKKSELKRRSGRLGAVINQINESKTATTSTTIADTPPKAMAPLRKSLAPKTPTTQAPQVIIAQTPVVKTEADNRKSAVPTTPRDENRETLKVVTNTPQERRILEAMSRSGEPKCVVARLPANLIPSLIPQTASATSARTLLPSVSANQASKVMQEHEKRLSKDFTVYSSAVTSSVLQNYRMQQSILTGTSTTATTSTTSTTTTTFKTTVSTSAIKSMAGTPSRIPQMFASVSNLNSVAQPRTSIAKFTATPSRLTRTEMEERRRRDELMQKDAKDKERLVEMSKKRDEEREEKRRKQEEKMRKINELKQKQAEEAETKARELELKAKEAEERKQRLQEEAQRLKLKQQQQPVSYLSSILGSAQKKTNTLTSNLHQAKPPTAVSSNNQFIPPQVPVKLNQQDVLQKSVLSNKQQNQALTNKLPQQQQKTKKTVSSSKSDSYYVSDSDENEDYNQKKQPLQKIQSTSKKVLHQQNSNQNTTYTNYPATPLQPPKLRDENNYDVSDLRSSDDTDDEDEPSKPMPAWAKEPMLSERAQNQFSMMINYTRLFRSSASSHVVLEDIFTTKRRKFTERTSSAMWTTPPVWATGGIDAEASFIQVRMKNNN